jgi:hypothetical protein
MWSRTGKKGGPEAAFFRLIDVCNRLGSATINLG